MKTTFVLALASAAVASGAHGQIVQWNFNSVPPDALTTTGTITANVGTGTASLVGGTTSTFAGGSPSDPASAGTDNSGWNLAAFAPQGTGSGARGAQFTTSTVGFIDIEVLFDMRLSATASRFWQLQYTTDGSTYNNVTSLIGLAGGPAVPGTNTVTFGNNGLISFTTASSSQVFAQTLTYTFFNGNGVENNTNFGLRLVAVFDPVNGANYISSNAGTTTAYSVNGTLRLDMVTIIPTPGAAALLGIGGLMISRRRR